MAFENLASSPGYILAVVSALSALLIFVVTAPVVAIFCLFPRQRYVSSYILMGVTNASFIHTQYS